MENCLRPGAQRLAQTKSPLRTVLIRANKRSLNLAAECLLLRCGDGTWAGSAAARVLAEMTRRPGWEVFLASLPVAGTDGTLKRRMLDPPVRGRVAAKTGYIAQASCLSGYVLDGRGRPAIAFSILTRPKPGKAWLAKQLQDTVCLELVRWLDESAVAAVSTGPR